MGKNWFVILVLIIAGVGIWYIGRYANPEPNGTPPVNVKTYTSSLYPISFQYPDSYVLSEADRGTGERWLHIVTLTRSADLPPPQNGEGPPTIEIAFYQNDIDRSFIVEWITGSNASNYKLGPGNIASTTVDGAEAARYEWSGLYEGKTTVFLAGDAIVAASVSYLTREDEILDVYGDVLDSIQIAPSKDDLIFMSMPLPEESVSSPLRVTGKARGNWYFEASFPVKIYDSKGTLLTQGPAQAQSEWMTTVHVPYTTTLTFSKPTTDTGFLVLEKDNPSGLPEHDNELRIPIRFAPEGNSGNNSNDTQKILLYYYNPQLDQGPGGAQCSKNGLVSVERNIPKSQTPLRDSILELMKGNITAAEKAQGISTEFPLSGLTLENASINNGVATLKFRDTEGKTVGGSCRVAVLWHQIEATAKQFSTITAVRFAPEELFQP